ncbi:MAG: plastocyanin/azurin family copper-binding protein [Myxococcota bacterium]|nr:plastocyanin/azurin family copper-binding protein [Myxococcota bacterium]
MRRYFQVCLSSLALVVVFGCTDAATEEESQADSTTDQTVAASDTDGEGTSSDASGSDGASTDATDTSDTSTDDTGSDSGQAGATVEEVCEQILALCDHEELPETLEECVEEVPEDVTQATFDCIVAATTCEEIMECEGGPGDHSHDDDHSDDDDHSHDDDQDDDAEDIVTDTTGDDDADAGCSGIVHVVTPAMGAMRFDPESLIISAGDMVRFEMNNYHNAVEVSQATYDAGGTTPLADGFNAGYGQTIEVCFPEAGVHYYVCQPHVQLGMIGTVTVQ